MVVPTRFLTFLILLTSLQQQTFAAEPVVRLGLNEGNGTVASDSSGAGNHGVLIGNTEYVSDTPDNSSFAIRLDKSADRIDLNSLELTGSALTLSAWFKANSFTGKRNDPQIISKASSNALNDHFFKLGTIEAGSGVRLRARIRTNGTTKNLRADPGSELITDRWYHAAAIYDGQFLKLYLDGVEVGSTGLSGNLDQNSSVGVSIGSRTGGGNQFDGIVDDIQIYDVAITPAELQGIIAGNGRPASTADFYSATEDVQLSVDETDGLLVNDSDPENQTLSAILIDDVSNGTLVLSSNGSFSYTPDDNYFGSDSFSYQSSDGLALSDITEVSIFVEPVNDSPIALEENYLIPKSGTFSVDAPGVLSNDVDVESGALSVVSGSVSVENGTLILASDGSFNYTPVPGFTGTDFFTYSAIDESGASSAEVTVTLQVVSLLLANDDNFSLSEDAVLNILEPGVLTNDIDGTPPKNLTVELVSGPDNGSLLLDSDGSFSFEPSANFSGSDSFIYRVIDGDTGSTAVANVNLVISPVNDLPISQPDFYNTVTNIEVTGNVLSNDSDIDGDSLSAVLEQEPVNGTLNFQSDGSFSYTSGIQFTGEDSFSYSARDGEGSSPVTVVEISVTDSQPIDADLVVHHPFDDGLQPATDFSGNNNHGILSGPVYVPDTADGSSQSLRFDGNDDTVDLGGLDVAGPGLTLAAWFKVDSFPSVARDSRLISKASGISSSEHVFMLSTIAAGSQTLLRARIKLDDVTHTLVADSGNIGIGQWNHAAAIYDGSQFNLFLNGMEVGGVQLSGTLDQNPAVSVAVGSQPGGGDNFHGLIDDVRILRRAISENELLDLVFTGSGSPQAFGENYSLSEDMILNVDSSSGVLFNDTDPENDELIAHLVTSTSNGELSLLENGAFSYTPDLNFAGSDSFTYRVSDGSNFSTVVTAELLIDNVNDIPSAGADSFQSSQDKVLDVEAPGLLVNDTDLESESLTVVAGSIQVSHGELNLNSNGSFSYRPDSNHPGEDSFSYRAVDQSGGVSIEALVSIFIAPPPAVVADSYETTEDTVLDVSAPGLLSNDIDTVAPGDLQVELVTVAEQGNVVLSIDGGFIYTPNPNYFGSDSFEYRAIDPVTGIGVTGLVELEVVSVNDPPVSNTDNFETSFNTPVSGNVVLNDIDVDSNIVSASLVLLPQRGTIEFDTNGDFTYTPELNFIGEDSFTYRASDGDGESGDTLVTVLIVSDPDSNPDVLVKYSFEDGLNPVTNSGSYDHNGTWTGAAYTTETGNGSGSALEFNGSGDTLDVGPLDVSGSGLTLAAWFKADSFPGSARDPRIISKASSTSEDDHIFLLGTVKGGNETRLRARVRVNGNTYTLRADPGFGLSTGTWYHAATTYDGAKLLLYLNGALIGSRNLSGPVDQDSSVRVAVGSQPNGSRSFNGIIDDVLIMERAASQAEVEELSMTNAPPVAVADSYMVNEDVELLVDSATGVLANDSDPDASGELTSKLVSSTSHGDLDLSPDGSFSYVPNLNFFGQDEFSYLSNDGLLDSSVVSVSILVESVNDVPIANNDEFHGFHGEDLHVTSPGVLENDLDTELQQLISIPGTLSAEHGDVAMQEDGSFIYTPNASHPGTDKFSYSAYDPAGGVSEEAQVSINLTEVQVSAIDDSYSTSEDAVLVENAPGVLGNDMDLVEPSDLQVSLLSSPFNGTVALDSDGSFIYAPDPDYFGVDSFFYSAIDAANGSSDDGVVTIEVSPVPDAPVAVPDSYLVEFETQLIGNVLLNDYDADIDVLSVTEVTSVQNGVLVLGTDGEFTYTPNIGFSGSDEFSYKASDGVLESETVIVMITVYPEQTLDSDLLVHLPLNDGQNPVTDVSGSGNSGVLVGAEYATASGDGSASSLSFDGISDLVNLGTLNIPGDEMTIAAWFRADSFPGNARDSRIVSKSYDTGTNAHFFMLSTIAVGSETRLRARVRINGTTHTLRADAGNNLVVGQWYHGAAVYNGSSFQLFQNGSLVASMSLSGGIDQEDTVNASVGAQPSGEKPWHGHIDEVRIYKRALQSSEIEDISEGNLDPIAVGDEFNVSEDNSLVIGVENSVLLNDIDEVSNSLTAQLEDPAEHGTVTLNSDGSFEYTPASDYFGIDFFTYSAYDGNASSAVATVVLNVEAVNDAPVARDDEFQINPEQTFTSSMSGVLHNDSDVELDALEAIQGATEVGHGQLNLNGDGSFTYTPEAGFLGTDVFSYRSRDAHGELSDEAQVNLFVAVPPIVIEDTYDLIEDDQIVISAPGLLSNDIDQSAPFDLTIELSSAPQNGDLTLGSDGGFVYEPDENYFGEDSFTYTARDPITLGSAQAMVTLIVEGTPDSPVAVSDSYNTAFDTELTGNVLLNDFDPDEEILSAVLGQPPLHGTLELSSEGSFTYLPVEGFVGADSFTYTSFDGSMYSSETVVSISVAPFVPPDLQALVHLPLNDGLNPAIDVSGFGNHGSVVGATYSPDTGDESTSALEFDGINDRIELGTLDAAMSALTLAAWIKADSFPGDSNDPRIISKSSSADASDHIYSLTTVAAGSEIRLRLRLRIDGDTYTIRGNPGSNISTDQWHHVAATYNGSVAKLYLNGIEVKSRSLTGEIDRDASVTVAVGAEPLGGREFDGKIDEVRILKRAMTPDEVAFIAGDTAPNAAFVATPQFGDAPLAVNFDASSTTSFNEQGLDFSWDFGDGNFAHGKVVEHVYTDFGNFTATLTVTNPDGESSSVTKIIRSTTPGNSLRLVNWSLISTENGDILPPAGMNVDQTAAMTFDINNDDISDILIAGRGGFIGPSIEWWERHQSGWNRHVVEPDLLPLQVGAASFDIDSDGDEDFILGEDRNGSKLYWWENPYPEYSDRWRRRVITDIPGARYHDQIFGDFDGDGKTELAFWDNGARHIYLSEIPADPTLEPWPVEIIFTASANSEGFAAADIDLDGTTDLLGAGFWFKHNGQDGYDPIRIANDKNLVRVAAAQLIPGGRPEVVYDSAEGTDRLTMYQWDGDSWVSSELFNEDIERGHSLNIGDVNNDGHLDVMSGEIYLGGNTSPELRIFYGDGTGNFFPQLVSASQPNHESKLADLDGDGDLDILSKPFKETSPGFSIWLNDLDAVTLEWERHVVDASVPYRTVFVEHGDLNGDGLEDVATGAWWWRNPGVVGGEWDRFTIGTPLNQLATLYDFDEDGDLDILGTQGTGSGSNSNLSWAQNDGTGNFVVHSNIESAVGDFLQGVSAAKYVDGKLEVALSWQNCVGGLQMLTVPIASQITTDDWTWRVLDNDCGGESLDTADIDQDGDLDLLTGYTWYRNDGGDQYSRFDVTGETPGQPDRNILVDMDRDGDLDALVGFGHDPTKAISWFEQGEDPTQLWAEHPIGNFEIGLAQSVDVSDLDGDGTKEVVVGEHQFTNPPGLLLQIYKSQTDGTWLPQTVYAGDEHHDGAQLFDADNDGDLDIVSIGWTHRRLLIYENQSFPIDSPYDIPTSPENIQGLVLSDNGVRLSWDAAFDNFRVVAYEIYRDSILIATVTGLSYTDFAPTSLNHSYEVVAVDGDGNKSIAANIVVNLVNSSEGLWWDTSWPYRLLLGVGSGEFERSNGVVEIDIDFDQIILQKGGSELFEPETIRCHEVDADGNVIQTDIACQSNGQNLTLIAEGIFDKNSVRYFHIYFSEVGGGGSASSSIPLVQVTDDISHQGQLSFLIETPIGKYHYHKQGGGFSSLEDSEGVDWISFDENISGALGSFRGVPNLVHPDDGGHFHPGVFSSISTLTSTGPAKATINSVTTDGLWETVWDIYPGYATLTVRNAAENYWFLYEGTPGGVLDGGDSTVRSSGLQTLLPATNIWAGDIENEEWVYVSASEVDRSLFVLHHENDDIIDSYRPATTSGAMTILGFGRDNAASLLSEVPQRFTFGLIESTEFGIVKQSIDSIIEPVISEISEAVTAP